MWLSASVGAGMSAATRSMQMPAHMPASFGSCNSEPWPPCAPRWPRSCSTPLNRSATADLLLHDDVQLALLLLIIPQKALSASRSHQNLCTGLRRAHQKSLDQVVILAGPNLTMITLSTLSTPYLIFQQSQPQHKLLCHAGHDCLAGWACIHSWHGKWWLHPQGCNPQGGHPPCQRQGWVCSGRERATGFVVCALPDSSRTWPQRWYPAPCCWLKGLCWLLSAATC